MALTTSPLAIGLAVVVGGALAFLVWARLRRRSPKTTMREESVEGAPERKRRRVEKKNEHVEMQEVVVAHVQDVPRGGMREVELAPQKKVLVVHTTAGAFTVTAAKCTHAGAPLAKGVLAGDRIVCPWHGACFHAHTGDVEDAPALDAISTFPVRVEGDRVLATLPAVLPSHKRTMIMCSPNEKMDSSTFVILGTGAAGAVAAETLRHEGFQGRIVMVGQEPHLPYDRVKISKSLGISVQDILLRDAAFYKEHGIEILVGATAEQVNVKAKTVELSTGEILSFEKLLIATGGHARRLRCEGHMLRNIYTLRVAEDAGRVHALIGTVTHVVIVGSSFIGMEVASVLKLRKVPNVLVVGMEQVPFERVLGKEVGTFLQHLAESKGVEFRMGATVKRFLGNGDVVTGVELVSGEILPADCVVLGVGIELSSSFVVDQPGIEVNPDRSISVDGTMKATEDIYAAGDIARFPLFGRPVRLEHWDVAQQQGRLAARNMMQVRRGVEASRWDRTPIFWTGFFGIAPRYAGYCSEPNDILLKGTFQDKKFAVYYIENHTIAAVLTVGVDPLCVAISELMRQGRVPSVGDLRTNDIMFPVTLVGMATS